MTNDYNPHTHELLSARGEKGRRRELGRSARDCKAIRAKESAHDSCVADPAQGLSQAPSQAEDCNDLGLGGDLRLDTRYEETTTLRGTRHR